MSAAPILMPGAPSVAVVVLALLAGARAHAQASPPDAGASPEGAAAEKQPAPDRLMRSAAAPPRTAIPEAVSGDLSSQYFFLHEDNFFALQSNGGSPPRVKFQLSVRFEMVSIHEEHNLALNFAYTQKSFWDMLAFGRSSPFVESNYRPELFLSYRPDRSLRYRELQLGYLHESNGLGASEGLDQSARSRSWNCFFLESRWGFSRAGSAAPWFFPTLGARVWYPFAADAGLIDAIGHVAAILDVDLSVPGHLRLGRFSTRLTVREHAVQDDLFFALLPVVTGGRVRAWLFAQVFHGKAERLTTVDQSVTHFYFGLGFQ